MAASNERSGQIGRVRRRSPDVIGYDSRTQMYIFAPQEPDMDYLKFLRILADVGRLEHCPFGPSSGPLVQRVGAANRTYLMDKS